ncbi:hypothetical protein R6Q57_003138 [Mikania cordata]
MNQALMTLDIIISALETLRILTYCSPDSQPPPCGTVSLHHLPVALHHPPSQSHHRLPSLPHHRSVAGYATFPSDIVHLELQSIAPGRPPHHDQSQISPPPLLHHLSPMESSEQVLGCRVIFPWFSRSFRSSQPQPQYEEDQVDPFSLVADELSIVANRLRSMVVAEVPKLASAAEYFFKMGVEGKRFRPTVILLMATALNVQISKPASEGIVDMFSTELRLRLQSVAEITEMIHVASLLHDDVLDDADTRRGIGSLNFVMGNKISVLAGDFLLSRACITLASLKNTEVVSLIATAVEHLVTGETMQMSSSAEQRSSMDYYLQKTYYKTASLISNSCKSIALLTGQTAEVAMLAYEYGKNLGLAFQLIDDVLDFTGTSSSLGKGSLSDIRHGIVTAPILYAMEEFPELRSVVDRGLDNPDNVDLSYEGFPLKLCLLSVCILFVDGYK